jgi:two-component system cell cycle sensor histidine kinase/response regulator CckA
MSDETISVLLVEGSSRDSRLVREMLEDIAMADPAAPTFDLTSARRLSTTLKRLAKGGFDVVLLNLSLPDSQGLATFVKAHAQAPEVPIIVLSDLEDKALAVEAVQKGAQDYLVKGEVEGTLLVRAIRYAVECKRAEGALMELEKKFRTLAEQSPNMIFINKRGRVVYANERCEEVMGYTRDEFYSADFDFLTLIAPEHRELITASFAKHVKGEEVEPYEYTLVTKDGKRVEAILTTRLIDYEGEKAILGTVTDITERVRAEVVRRQAEEALRESERRFRGIFENATMGLYRTTLDGRILMANPALVHMLGYSSFEELAQRDLSKGGYEPKYPRSAFQQRIESEGQVIGLESAWVTRDGTTLFIRESAKAIRDEAGNTLYYEGTVEDITERKQAAEALQHRVEFEQLITSISTHFINLAPDKIDVGINRALQAIGGFAGVDRSYVFLFRDGGTTMDNTHEWCAEGIEPQVERLKGVPTDVFPWSLEKIRRFETAHIPRVADLPAEASAEKEEFQAEGIQSLVMVPMVYSGAAIGFLGFDSVRAEKTWPEDIIALLRIAGEIFANALERKRIEDALRDSQAELSAIIENAPIIMLLVDQERRVLKINDAGVKFIGRSAEEMIGLRGGEALCCLHALDDPRGCGFGPACETCTVRRTVVDTFETGNGHHQVEAELVVVRGEEEDARSLLVSTAPLVISGNPRVLVSIEDITEQRHAEKASQRRRAVLGAMALAAEKLLRPGDWKQDIQAVLAYLGSTADVSRVLVTEVSASDDGRYLVSGRYEWIAPEAKLTPLQGLQNVPVFRRWRDFLPRGEIITGHVRDLSAKEQAFFVPRGIKSVLIVPIFVNDAWWGFMGFDQGGTEREWTEAEIDALKTAASILGGALERKQAEEALRESEARYKELANSITDVFFAMGKNLRYTYWNTASEKLVGIAARDAIGKSIQEIFPDTENTRRSIEVYREVLKTQKPRTFVTDYQLAGKGFFFEISAYPSRDGVAVFAKDITERRRAEEALRIRDSAMASSLTAMAIAEFAGNLTYVNSSFLEMWGYEDESEVLGRPAIEFWQEPEKAGEVVEALRSRDGWTGELTAKRKDGSLFDVQLSASIVVDENDEPVCMMASFVDITERKQAEEALERSEATLRSIFRVAPIGIGLVRDRVHQWANETFCQMLGYSEEELRGQGARMIYPSQEEYERVRKEKYEQIKEQGTGTIETRLQRKDGRIIDVLMSSTPLDPADLSAGVTFTALDITERKRAEKALRDAEAEKENILDSQLEHVIYQDREHRMLWPNRAACESVDMTREELVGRYCYEIWAQRSERCEDCPVALAIETGQQQEVEKTTPDGRAWFIRGYPVRDAAGEIVGAIEVTQDITARVRAEEERAQLLAQIQEQAQRVQQIMDTVPEGVFLLDTNHRVVLANPLGQKDLAALAGTGIGDPLTRLGDRPIEELLTSPPRGLWHEVTTDSRAFQVIARPIEDGAEPHGWVLVVRDMTKQREIERRIQQQERLAAVGQLAAGIAHDFNNIMAVITLYAGMSLRMPDLPAKVYERLDIIDEQARRASDLIQQILDFSRRAVLERRPMELVPFLKEQVRLLQRTLPESIKIDLTYGKDEYVVNADPTRMQQAIMNLATNARDAMPEGGRLHIELEQVRVKDRESAPLSDMEAGDWVRVTMADTGTGIPADVLPHIFDPFFTTKAPGLGTGLGLSQVYGTVRQHEGHIDVSTKAGEGTTFVLYLPALAPRHPEVLTSRAEPLAQGQEQTILVVEDDAAARKALVDSLELLNYKVLEATNGREALAVFEQHAHQIALVLSDVVMPEMGGRALLHALRERDPAVKVVLLTGHPLEGGGLDDLRAQGLEGWLLKPLSMEQLAQAMAQALEEE